MNYSQFINSNDSQLRKNYLKLYKHIKRSSFNEYCKFIFVALDKGFWLDSSYKKGIIFNKQENK